MFSANLTRNISLRERLKGYKNYYLNEYLKFFLLYRSKYNNYLHVIIKVLQGDYPIQAVLKEDKKKITFHDYREVYNHIVDLNCDSEKDIAYVKGLWFYGGKKNGNIHNVFTRNEYDTLDVKNKTVIDIGANIADSSIFFAMKGAKKVYAFEPVRETYELAKKNVEENGFSDIIEIIWAGCGALNLDELSPWKVQITTLESIIQKYDLHPDILKMDCEGCEYEVILSCPDSIVRMFSQIQIEYHYGYHNLKEKLERCHFQISVTEPVFFKPFDITPSLAFISEANQVRERMFVGYIYAERPRNQGIAAP